jgi:hypothetical protein
VPNASDFDSFIPVVVEDVHHRLGPDEVDFSRGSGDKLAVCGEIARIDFRDLDIFFENFHSVLYRRMINGIARKTNAIKKPATSSMTGRRLWGFIYQLVIPFGRFEENCLAMRAAFFLTAARYTMRAGVMGFTP